MSDTTATATVARVTGPAHTFTHNQVRELRTYGHRTGERRVPRGEWERAEWDHLAELAMGAH
jgi:hypothetical protein